MIGGMRLLCDYLSPLNCVTEALKPLELNQSAILLGSSTTKNVGFVFILTLHTDAGTSPLVTSVSC